MVEQNDHNLMRVALNVAWAYQGLTFPNPAVGAVVSDEDGKILGIGAHRRSGLPHAEVEALKEAYKSLSNDHLIDSIEDSSQLHNFLKTNHQNLFHNLILHVTLEPCNHYGKTPPCSQLIYDLGFKKVVIGSLDRTKEARGGGDFLKSKGVEVVYGCLEKECDMLLEPFMAWQKEEPFVFFKIALSANGVAKGGIISCEASRKRVHQLRDKCDLLVIGGNTVRTDRPILDARLCDGKAPDILIYSHHKNFDKTIPLFGVENRKVFIENSLDKIKNYKMVMVEGGQNMLDVLEKQLRWFLIFRSFENKEGEKIVLPPVQEIFSCQIETDKMSWFYRNE
ncbi:MAG: bifunctional diaminohydroxyphosphoribosylaminopyrimidine deaminase/5-amino-6-(5-phosphoribosylamino)uracil reductase RibD [Sulfurospirillaceae bacterium]|nr:bifunctional diaminohydroxyphosphoribosylaminopyrimidine deaminase/5-amino-6-(5-phosphoribosylamino)uracil reductase RibD [Sulfurospirillaceae bacterium]